MLGPYLIVAAVITLTITAASVIHYLIEGSSPKEDFTHLWKDDEHEAT